MNRYHTLGNPCSKLSLRRRAIVNFKLYSLPRLKKRSSLKLILSPRIECSKKYDLILSKNVFLSQGDSLATEREMCSFIFYSTNFVPIKNVFQQERALDVSDEHIPLGKKLR